MNVYKVTQAVTQATTSIKESIAYETYEPVVTSIVRESAVGQVQDIFTEINKRMNYSAKGRAQWRQGKYFLQVAYLVCPSFYGCATV